jgi:hypothetical protein
MILLPSQEIAFASRCKALNTLHSSSIESQGPRMKSRQEGIYYSGGGRTREEKESECLSAPVAAMYYKKSLLSKPLKGAPVTTFEWLNLSFR